MKARFLAIAAAIATVAFAACSGHDRLWNDTITPDNITEIASEVPTSNLTDDQKQILNAQLAKHDGSLYGKTVGDAISSVVDAEATASAQANAQQQQLQAAQIALGNAVTLTLDSVKPTKDSYGDAVLSCVFTAKVNAPNGVSALTGIAYLDTGTTGKTLGIGLAGTLPKAQPAGATFKVTGTSVTTYVPDWLSDYQGFIGKPVPFAASSVTSGDGILATATPTPATSS